MLLYTQMQELLTSIVCTGKLGIVQWGEYEKKGVVYVVI